MFIILRNQDRQMAIKGLLVSIVIQFIPILWFFMYSFGDLVQGPLTDQYSQNDNWSVNHVSFTFWLLYFIAQIC